MFRMKFNSANLLLVVITFESYLAIEAARILAVLPFFGKSHHSFSQPLLKSLARAGHEVVVYSPFPLEKPMPNYTDVFIVNLTNEKEVIKLALRLTEKAHVLCFDSYLDFFETAFTNFIKSENVQLLLKSEEHFDLIITEIFSGQEFTLILGHIFKAPVIGIQSYVTNSIVNSISGNTLSISHIPNICSSFSNKMSFFKRVQNTLSLWRNLNYVYYNKYIPLVEYVLRKHFPDSPPLLDMINNVSLIFVNDHLTADYAQPRTPNIIPVAGIHIETNDPLPKTLQQFIDGATDGIVLFSMGTYVPDELQPKKYFDTYNNVFRQLRQKVLWKTKKVNIQGLPDNVMTVKWVPQRDVLAHPNCVLFITHGGLLSQHEAVHYGVPVVAIPQFWDQHRNGRFYEEQGIGIQLHHRDLTEQSVFSAIQNVINNQLYKTNMKRLSKIFKDRPMTPAQTVVYWTEYVLRHGAFHLRPASTQLSWYQLALLDVCAVVTIIIVSIVLAIYLVCRRIFMNKYIIKNNSPRKEKLN